MHFQNVYIFAYQKDTTSYTLLLVFKIVESLQCMLKVDSLQKVESRISLKVVSAIDLVRKMWM